MHSCEQVSNVWAGHRRTALTSQARVNLGKLISEPLFSHLYNEVNLSLDLIED